MQKNSVMAYKIDPDEISTLIVSAADQYIRPRYQLLQAEHIDTKSGPGDLVTIADHETEAALSAALEQMFPGAAVIGEESVASGAKSLDILQNKAGMVWVADPVDGTWNFVHGKREFAVMLACVIDGETRFGWIYDVMNDKMLVTEKGGGAFFDGQKLATAAPKPMADLVGHIGMKYFPKYVRGFVSAQKERVRSAESLRCAGHEYIRLASGQSDFGIYNRCKPWDHLAGVLAVQEAGGQAALWDGAAYDPTVTGGGLLVTSNGPLWHDIHGIFIDKVVEEINLRQ